MEIVEIDGYDGHIYLLKKMMNYVNVNRRER